MISIPVAVGEVADKITILSKILFNLINNQVEITPNNPAMLITSTLLVVNIVYKHAITIIHNINLNILFSLLI